MLLTRVNKNQFHLLLPIFVAIFSSYPGSPLCFSDLCIILMLLLLVVSGSISTAAFTLMMQCSRRAKATCQASHYSLLATAEVLGKLLFSVFVGALTDAVGYPWAFGLFTLLSIIVLPLFSYTPHCLLNHSSQKDVERTAKIH